MRRKVIAIEAIEAPIEAPVEAVEAVEAPVEAPVEAIEAPEAPVPLQKSRSPALRLKLMHSPEL